MLYAGSVLTNYYTGISQGLFFSNSSVGSLSHYCWAVLSTTTGFASQVLSMLHSKLNTVQNFFIIIIWAIYNDLSRGHPKWWFSKGIPQKIALNQVKDL